MLVVVLISTEDSDIITIILRFLTLNVICQLTEPLLKYGYSSFKLEILEYCDPQNVIIREQFYFDLLKPEYNILAKAGSCLGFKHSAETKQKVREAEHSGRFKKGHQPCRRN